MTTTRRRTLAGKGWQVYLTPAQDIAQAQAALAGAFKPLPHARMSWRHWMAQARQARIDPATFTNDLAQHANALAGAAGWRRRIAEINAMARCNTRSIAR